MMYNAKSYMRRLPSNSFKLVIRHIFACHVTNVLSRALPGGGHDKHKLFSGNVTGLIPRRLNR